MAYLRTSLLAFLVFTSSAFAGMTVDSYKTDPDKNDIDTYVAGLLNGFAFANTELSRQKRSPLYCPPSDLSITIHMGRTYLERGFKRYNKLSLPMLEIEPLLLRELMEAYPCKR